MTEPYAELDEMFAEFRTGLTGQVTAPGPGEVRRVVRRRRRTAVVVATVVATALVAVPAAVLAAVGGNGDPPEPGGRTTPPPSATSPPTPTPTPTADASRRPRITVAELTAARLDLPPWPADVTCGAQDVRVHAKRPSPYQVWLTKAAYGDIDGDGSEETVTVLRCMSIGGGGAEQAVAWHRDSADGLVALGQVLSTDAEDVAWLSDVRVDPGGTIGLRAGDLMPTDDTPREWAQRQWRTYALSGKGFQQTGGPTAFGPNPHLNDVRMRSKSDLTFGPAADAAQRRTGTHKVLIRNDGSGTVPVVRITWVFEVPDIWPSGAGWSGCRDSGRSTTGGGGVGTTELWCETGPIRAGSERVLTFGFHTFSRFSTTNATVGVTTVTDAFPDARPPDPVLSNNAAGFKARAAQ